MKAILDAGALVAVDRRNRLIGAQLRVLQRQGTPIRVSSAVVGQVWRDGRKQANLARVLAGAGIEALGKDDGKRIGELLALSGSADIVDAHVALIIGHADRRDDQRSRRHSQAPARSQGFGAGPDRVRLLDLCVPTRLPAARPVWISTSVSGVESRSSRPRSRLMNMTRCASSPGSRSRFRAGWLAQDLWEAA